jgi:hypothetical protein
VKISVSQHVFVNQLVASSENSGKDERQKMVDGGKEKDKNRIQISEYRKKRK